MSSVSRISTDRENLYAFAIDGEVSADTMEAMAKTMNEAFDRHDEKVDMLLVFRNYAGSETGSLFDADVLASRMRSLTKVERYVVVGAPDAAGRMVQTLGTLMPVQTRAYPLDELDDAFSFLNARPTD